MMTNGNTTKERAMQFEHDACPPIREIGGAYSSQDKRDNQKIGKIHFSIQASELHYCEPRENGLALSQYSAVEVALFCDDLPGLLRPSQVGLDKKWDDFFEEGLWNPVAGYVPIADVLAMMEEAERLAKV